MNMNVCPYRYTSLTAAIGDRTSPLRQLLTAEFPNTRLIQAEYRAARPTLRVEGGSSNPGTLGGAFDYATRFRLDHSYSADLARLAFLGDENDLANIDAVIVAAQVAQSIGDRSTVFRASWALSLLTEVYRIGLAGGSPLAALLKDATFDAMHLLELAPEDAIRQLDSLVTLAETALIPNIAGPFRIGPIFDGSALCAADADIIAGDLLLDLKTRLGDKVKRAGGRSDTLRIQDLLQLVGYALFDRSDTYRIARVGIYSARFGRMVVWGLDELLEKLAGQPVDLSEMRERVWAVLGGDSDGE
ncbi:MULTISPECIES: hypothetical protein [unclassified Microbacterium]|uniref:hypothetical protein n=1 Tax=unclassified Microbacterium TaxID=2609290 RepID=UPI003448A09A